MPKPKMLLESKESAQTEFVVNRNTMAAESVSKFQVSFRERPITISKPIQVTKLKSAAVHTHLTENPETVAHIVRKLAIAEASDRDRPAPSGPRLTGAAAARRLRESSNCCF
jgi:hypothetical protein